MLGLSNTLSSSTIISEAAGPIQLVSYTSDFSTASLDGWSFNASNEVTITSNNDSVGGQDDALKYDFTTDITQTRSIIRANTLATGGIVAGDTIDVTFKYRIERTGDALSNMAFSVRPGGFNSSRNYTVTVITPLFDQWNTLTHTFDNPAATSNDDFYISFASGAFRPKNGDAIYFKDFQITHNGLAR